VNPPLSLQRDSILRQAVELGASDLILTAGHPVMVTIAGVLQPLPDSPALSPEDSRRLAESFLTPALHERFLRDLELDTRFDLAGVAHFRVNLFVQRGAWGEQNTAKVLKPLAKEGWLVRHDLATRSGRGNRDHIIAGQAVYLLDSKLLRDHVAIEGNVLHVRRVDDSGDEYSVKSPTSCMRNAARTLERDIDEALGFPVAVYPVVVIWGHFAAGVEHAGGVMYVDGEKLADWLRSRPADLRDERKRELVREWLRSLPRA